MWSEVARVQYWEWIKGGGGGGGEKGGISAGNGYWFSPSFTKSSINLTLPLSTINIFLHHFISHFSASLSSLWPLLSFTLILYSLSFSSSFLVSHVHIFPFTYLFLFLSPFLFSFLLFFAFFLFLFRIFLFQCSLFFHFSFPCSLFLLYLPFPSFPFLSLSLSIPCLLFLCPPFLSITLPLFSPSLPFPIPSLTLSCLSPFLNTLSHGPLIPII